MGLFDRRRKEKEKKEKLEFGELAEGTKENTVEEIKEEAPQVIEEVKEENPLAIDEVKEETPQETEEVKEEALQAIEEVKEETPQASEEKKEENKPKKTKDKKPSPKKPEAKKQPKQADDDDDEEDDNEEENENDVDVTAKYNHKMLIKLKMASDRVDKYYSDFRNLILSYEKIKFRSNNACDVYLLNNKPIIKINVFQRSLKVHYALKPTDFPVNKYHHKDVSDTKKYEMVPLQMKISSDRAYKYAVEILEVLMKNMKANLRAKPKVVNYVDDTASTSKELLELLGLNELLRTTCSKENAEILPDTTAKRLVVLETLKTELPPLSERVIGEVTIGELSAAFKSTYIIDLDLLKATEIVDRNCNYLKVIEGGRCTRAITVKANDFDLDVIKMIVLTGGNAIKLIP